VTHLRQIMLEELERRNYASATIRCYIRTVEHRALLLVACSTRCVVAPRILVTTIASIGQSAAGFAVHV
jgi:hypothetical protein